MIKPERETQPKLSNALVAEPLGDIVNLYAGKMMPNLQASTFRNSHKIFPTRKIPMGKKKILKESLQPAEALEFQLNSSQNDIFDYISKNRVAGLLVYSQGKVVCEHYESGNTADSLWVSMSMAKSVATTLVGVAIKDGFIKNVDEQLVEYLPELKGSAYDGVSIRHLMQMTSGVAWNDQHTDPNSDRRIMLDYQVEQKPGLIMDYICKTKRQHEPGTHFNYSFADTFVVGALLKAATGEWLSDYLSRRIWIPMGMEKEGMWWLDSVDGLEVAGCGICATLRDFSRLGIYMLQDGKINGEPTLPENWTAESTSPRIVGGETLNYGYMWWPVPDESGSFKEKAFSARGIFGQYIYINPTRQLIISVASARSKPMHSEAILDNDFFNALKNNF